MHYLPFLIVCVVTAALYVVSRLRGAHTHCLPPQATSLLAGYDNGLLYVLNPRAFLFRCQQRCGPVYRVSLGSWRLVVVSSGDAISSVFFTSPKLLRNDVMHREMFYVVAGIKDNYPYLHEVMVRDLYPLVDKSLSPRSLGQTMHGFGLVLLSQINNFIRGHDGLISLMQLTGEPLYNATNLVLLGSAFPTNTYRDFHLLNKSVPYRFLRTLLWPWSRSSYSARMCLLNTLRDYLLRGESDDCSPQFSKYFMKAFKNNGIQSLEGAQLVLNFLWGVHSNTLSNAFFLISFLLSMPDNLAQIRAEIDLAVRKHGSLEALLETGPDELDDPSFRLLTSAIMETMRLTGLHAGVRQASEDFDLKLKDESMISIKKGEYVFGNVHAAHMDETAFANPGAFVVDRFAQQPYRKGYLQTEGYSFHSLGGGRHICKGRWLAVFEIKVLVIILLHTLDFSPEPTEQSSTGWRLPRVHSRSIGVIHTEDDFFVQLSPRQATAIE